jgi:UDPglucose 6-dehydrogenase
MKIGIIGAGFVGSAVAHAHLSCKDEVIINDPKHPKSVDLENFTDCDAIFVCVPSPSMDDGRCDTSILESVLKNLLFVNIAKQIPIISKVTAPPSVYKRLQTEYPNLVHAPEFLTAKNAMWDYRYGKLCVIGGDSEWSTRAAVAILRGMVEIRNDNVIFTDIVSASLYKYMMNSYLATKVTFMNEFAELANKLDVDWNQIKKIIRADSRIGDTHLDVPGPDGQYGWGGFCFPKDVAAICEEAMDHYCDFELLQRVEVINDIHRRKK